MRKNTKNYNPKEMKISTMDCYINNFYKFWKWLSQNSIDVVTTSPPDRRPKSFQEIKEYSYCPLIIKNITAELFFDFIKSRKNIKDKSLSCKVQCSLKYISIIFNKYNDYVDLITNIRNKEMNYLNIEKRESFKNVLIYERWEIMSPEIIYNIQPNLNFNPEEDMYV